MDKTDKRYKILEAALRRNGNQGHALIECLHVAQKTYGYLEDALLRDIARGLRLPLSKVYGVATFYHLFVLKPQGRHSCVVCTGTACYIKGAGRILQAIADEMHLQPGMTRADNSISLLQARCFGACALAPAMSVDGVVEGNCTPAGVLTTLQALAGGDIVAGPGKPEPHDPAQQRLEVAA